MLVFLIFMALCLWSVWAQAQELSSQQERWVKSRLDSLTKATAVLKASDLKARRLIRPEIHDEQLRRRLSESALELGLDPARFVVAEGEGNLSDFSGAFAYISADTVRASKERLQFAMAHEYAHLALGHGLQHLKMLFVSAALNCFTCVQRKDPADVALAFATQNAGVFDAIVREDEMAADAWATRYLADRHIIPNYTQVMASMHEGGTCDAVEYGSHPSCKARLQQAYRILAGEYVQELSQEELVRLVFSGAADVGKAAPPLAK